MLLIWHFSFFWPHLSPVLATFSPLVITVTTNSAWVLLTSGRPHRTVPFLGATCTPPLTFVPKLSSCHRSLWLLSTWLESVPVEEKIKIKSSMKLTPCGGKCSRLYQESWWVNAFSSIFLCLIMDFVGTRILQAFRRISWEHTIICTWFQVVVTYYHTLVESFLASVFFSYFCFPGIILLNKVIAPKFMSPFWFLVELNKLGSPTPFSVQTLSF